MLLKDLVTKGLTSKSERLTVQTMTDRYIYHSQWFQILMVYLSSQRFCIRLSTMFVVQRARTESLLTINLKTQINSNSYCDPSLRNERRRADLERDFDGCSCCVLSTSGCKVPDTMGITSTCFRICRCSGWSIHFRCSFT